ncbi:MAG TPA: hypothetical protein VGK67_02305 [Myxococcales bacterium]|jgi:hypothetical protein
MANPEGEEPDMARAAKTVRPVIYRHTSHADWGMGMIVEENPAKVYLAFEDGVRRPFLNQQRYRDFLVPEALEPDAIDEIVAKITKSIAKPASSKTTKKVSKKAAAAQEETEEVTEEPERDEEEEPSDDE